MGVTANTITNGTSITGGFVISTSGGAGAGGTDRMVVMEADRKNFWMPMPLPFDMLTPQENGFGVDLLAEYVFGSFHVKRPLSMEYVDGI